MQGLLNTHGVPTLQEYWINDAIMAGIMHLEDTIIGMFQETSLRVP